MTAAGHSPDVIAGADGYGNPARQEMLRQIAIVQAQQRRN